MASPELSIVLPVYNEAAVLSTLCDELLDVLEPLNLSYEVIFVDDGSTDGSREIIRDLSCRHKQIKGILLSRNYGQTAALSAGFSFARGELIITLDADGQNDPRDIPKLLEKAKASQADIVSGWRRKRQDPWLTRRLPSALANWLISAVTGVKLHDYGCTMKVYRRWLIDSMQIYSRHHRFLPALASWYGARIEELKVNHRKRFYGRSHYGLSRTAEVLLDLITVKFLLSSLSSPMRVFGSIGLWTILLGVFTGLITIWLKLYHQMDMTGNPLLYLALGLMIIGVQFITLGLIAEMSARTYHETLGRPTYHVQEIAGEET